MLLIIITALIPAVILGWWIYQKDSLRPEPLRMLIQAFLYGVGSTFVTLVITQLLGMIGLLVYDLGSFTGAVGTALFAAALPEEMAKLLMLWLFLRKNPYYDEYFDGIVYAACVGLGFAGTENILYLLQVLINVLFVLLIWRVYRSTMNRIAELQQRDHTRMTPPPLPGSGPTPPPFPGSDQNNNTPMA